MTFLNANPKRRPPTRTFRLGKANAKLFGVCSGIGNYFGFNPVWARIGFVVSALFGVGISVLIYLAIAFIAD